MTELELTKELYDIFEFPIGYFFEDRGIEYTDRIECHLEEDVIYTKLIYNSGEVSSNSIAINPERLKRLKEVLGDDSDNIQITAHLGLITLKYRYDYEDEDYMCHNDLYWSWYPNIEDPSTLTEEEYHKFEDIASKLHLCDLQMSQYVSAINKAERVIHLPKGVSFVPYSKDTNERIQAKCVNEFITNREAEDNANMNNRPYSVEVKCDDRRYGVLVYRTIED